MEITAGIVLTSFLTIIIAAAALGFVGVPVMIRIRAALAAIVGVVVLGFFAWPMLKPSFPQGAVTLYHGDVSIVSIIACIILAALAGLLAYFAAWPNGRQLAPLAAPAGLAYVAFRSGQMFDLIIVNNGLTQRMDLYSGLKWEGIFWLAIVAAGYLGVFAAMKIKNEKVALTEDESAHKPGFNKGLAIAIALVAAVVIAQFASGIFAQDVRMRDPRLGTVIGQVATSQAALAMIIAFGLAALAVKYFLDISYVITTLATCLLVYWAMTAYGKGDILEYMTQNWPSAFYPRALGSILPLHIVAFGSIGCIAGYWSAVWFAHAKHEHEEHTAA
ncbi:hypothetical protein STSP2_01271 [Anaerohalosphaera lusitana]|uniref:Uncharacterized protein n=1 Tax=Anaerohalosphaera lusitana TaxID=1936003 RepID=A0A1U9NKS7_9BACT|nr:hypothetical protein [Anaerohalosphaera lusitana]AQT68116.1 hypothetical protein STSP2_01271 [Anaerohalosphaera lusitana]